MDASTRAFVQQLSFLEREAGYALMIDQNDRERQNCIDQFNDIYSELSRLNDDISRQFSPLSHHDSAGTLRMAVRDMIFFLEQ